MVPTRCLQRRCKHRVRVGSRHHHGPVPAIHIPALTLTPWAESDGAADDGEQPADGSDAAEPRIFEAAKRPADAATGVTRPTPEFAATRHCYLL